MITADYYPKKGRLDFIAPDGMIGGGIIGDRAHVRAAELIRSGSAIVRVCGINSKMNRKAVSGERYAVSEKESHTANRKPQTANRN